VLSLIQQATLQVRQANQDDVPSLVSIYNFEVVHGESNYESKLQPLEARALWLDQVQSKQLPVIVVEKEGRVVGFGALTPFHTLSGYQKTVTGCLYVAAEVRGLGAGKLLATHLKREAELRGLHSIIAGVNSRNTTSIALLKTFGFRQVGYFKEIGQKNGQWFDDVCLQLMLPKEKY